MPPLPTPKAADLSDPVLELCETISFDAQPIYLDVEPEDFAEVNECFPNVEKMIKQCGGSIQYGWQIWETLPEVMIEAEFHAVWVDTNGKYHDITPKELDIEKILFLPDNKTVYENKQVDNVRVSLTDDTLVSDYIKSSENIFEEMSKMSFTDDTAYILTPTIERIGKENASTLFKIINKYYSSKKTTDTTCFSGSARNKPCYCGSGKKYKKCCLK